MEPFDGFDKLTAGRLGAGGVIICDSGEIKGDARWMTGSALFGQKSVVTAKDNGDDIYPDKEAAAYDSRNETNRKLFLSEDPIADYAAEKKQRGTEGDHIFSSGERYR